MTKHDIIRAWKDPSYRDSLDAAERAQIPDHPAGPIELSDSQLDGVTGGIGSAATKDLICDTVTSSLRKLTK